MAWETVGGSRLANEFRRRAARYIEEHWSEKYPEIKLPPPTLFRNAVLIKMLHDLLPGVAKHYSGTRRKNAYRFWINWLPPTATYNEKQSKQQSDKRLPFYEGREWREVRYSALVATDGCCQCCGNRASKNKPLHVDHIKPRSKYPELELDISNLQVLCADCNLGKSNKDETDWREASAVACAETGSATELN